MTSPARVRIRDAHPADLAAIAGVFLACWRTSYVGRLPDEVTALYDLDGAMALWRRTLEDPGPPGAATLVAVAPERRVVGVVRAGRAPDEPSVGHVYSLYVDPVAQGQGVGTQLLRAADKWFRAEGLDEATLWVFSANGPAVKFYAGLGWEADGGQRVEMEYGQPEVRLRRRLAPG